MTLTNRKEVAEALCEIVRSEYRAAYGVPSLIRRGIRLVAERAQQMGLQPEDLLTMNGYDAFVTIARAIFAPRRPEPPRGSLCAEWRTVIQLAA